MANNEDDEVPRLWKVNRTIHELVRDRGFQVADYEINLSLDTFKNQYVPPTSRTVDRNQLNFFTNHRDDTTDQIFVFFSDEKSVGIKTMRKLLAILEEKGIHRGIIIFPGNMTPAARKACTPLTLTLKL
ncbi:RNA polymerase, partial [Schizophyllum fasciatum]